GRPGPAPRRAAGAPRGPGRDLPGGGGARAGRGRLGLAQDAGALPRRAARAAASAWLAATSRPDDVLFGYEPLYLQAWERGGHVSQTVIPRADSKLALKTLEAIRKPLGHGVWMFDASDTTNLVSRLEIPLTYPQPRSAFQVRAFGPFLIVRTGNPTRSVRTYLKLSRRVELVGESLSLGDADVNLLTVELAADRFAHEQRARALAQASARATSG